MRLLLNVLLVLAAPICGSGYKEAAYRVRTNRELQKVMNDADEFTFTNSDDGRSKELSPFVLNLFETEGGMIPEEFKTIVRGAMNKFLLTELNAYYAPQNNELIAVSSEINTIDDVYMNPDSDDECGNTGSGNGDCILGTLINMHVTCSFDNEPSPSLWKLEEKVHEVMLDLRYFISNFTALGVGLSDSELVDTAYISYPKEDEPTPAPSPGQKTSPATTSIQAPKATSQGGDGVAIRVVTPALAGAALIVGMVFLVFRRRKRSEPESPKQSMMYVDVEGDLYSMDRSLESSQSPSRMLESPLEERLPLSPKDRQPLSPTAGDSVFSGLVESPSGNGRTRSMMSGYTNASSATIRASNMERASKSKSAPGRGLFAFAEEGGEKYNDDSEEDDIVFANRDLPFMAKSEVSEDSDIENAASPSNARTSTLPRPSMSPGDAADDSSPKKSSSLNPFNWVYAKKEPKQPPQEKDYQVDVQSDEAQTPNSKSVYTPGVSHDMETPLKRNMLSPSSAAAPEEGNAPAQLELEWDNDVEAPGSVGSMSAKARAILGSVFGSGGTPGSGRSRRSKSMTPGNRSRASNSGTPGSPRSTVGSQTPVSSRSVGRNRSASKSRAATPTKVPSPESANRLGRQWLRGGVPDMHPAGDEYPDNLSRPSSPGSVSAGPSLQTLDYAQEGYGCAAFGGRVVDRAPGNHKDDLEQHGGRHHGGDKLGADGTAMYQTNAMQPLDWSYKSADLNSVGESTLSERDEGAMPSKFIFSKRAKSKSPGKRKESTTPLSESTKETNESSHSASRQLINDLVWLEKKIADVRNTSASAIVPSGAPMIEQADSLSYISNDDACISSSSNDEGEEPSVYTDKNDSVMSSIVCRDCYAPPGKLHIVIHSTKDGPAVHTVKEGSSLEGHIFPGDLIISVDNVDTRSFTAEQVMKMMAAKSDRERKITVLHFEEED